MVRKFIWIAAATGIVVMLAVGVLGVPQPAVTAIGKGSVPTEQAVNAAKGAIRAEPTVKDLLHQPGQAVEWQIGVLNDGTNRVGYANYICELLNEHNALLEGTQVRIVDIARVNAGESMRDASLGHVACADRRAIVP